MPAGGTQAEEVEAEEGVVAFRVTLVSLPAIMAGRQSQKVIMRAIG